jgi:hypothetical protein
VYMPPTESVVVTSSMHICHNWSPYLSEKRGMFWRLNILIWDSGRSCVRGFQLSKL